MSDVNFAAKQRTPVIRWTAMLFLAVGIIAAAFTVVRMVTPAVGVRCGAAGCTMQVDAVDLLPPTVGTTVRASAAARTQFDAYVAQPRVRAGLAGLAMLDGAPFIALTLSVGMALFRLMRRTGDSLASALPWLRRAAVAAMAMALISAFSDSLTAMLLLPGTPEGPMWYFVVNGLSLLLNLLLALAAAAVVHAISVGSQAQRDVAEFV